MQTASFWLASATAGFAGLVLFGYVFDIDFLINPTPWGGPIVPSTGFGLLLAGLAILGTRTESTLSKKVSIAAGILILSIAWLTFSERWLGWDVDT